MSKKRRVLYASIWWLESLMTAIGKQASERGWLLDFQMLDTGQWPETWHGDGIITTLSDKPDQIDRFLKRVKCPAVSLNQNEPDIDIPRVDMDMDKVGELAAGHFLERGFRSFAFYSRLQYHGCSLGFKAYKRILERNGYDAEHLDWQATRGHSRDTWTNRHNWLRRQLPRLPKPLAVFTTEDLAAVEIIEACLQEHIPVPDHIAVLGLLDIPLFRNTTSVPLSSIAVNYERQSREACDLLHRMMDGAPPPSAPILIPPVGVVARRSTDTLAAQTPAVAKAIRFILDHYSENIGIPELVSASGMCRTDLFRGFKADLGQSPHAILTRIRIDKARTLLNETSDKVETVAEACGFNDRSSLQRQFKQSTGLTPAEFRKTHR